MVGKRINAYLADHGIKKKFLSDNADIPFPVLSALLAGTRKIEVMQYYRICKALQVDVMTFLVDEESEI